LHTNFECVGGMLRTDICFVNAKGLSFV
jgi:hypothetical protein